MFENRIDAGERLARQLEAYRGNANAVVVGLPRGGVPVAYEIAQALDLPLEIICPRKIGAPTNKEFAIGAISDTGVGFFDRKIVEQLGVSQAYIDEEVEKEKQIAQKRLAAYRQGRPKCVFTGKCVLLVDDGLATGATMKAAIHSVRAEKPQKVVVAVPVAPIDTLEEISSLADEVACLESPRFFQAVGQFYEDFSPTEDEEVIALLKLASSPGGL